MLAQKCLRPPLPREPTHLHTRTDGAGEAGAAAGTPSSGGCFRMCPEVGTTTSDLYPDGVGGGRGLGTGPRGLGATLAGPLPPEHGRERGLHRG